MIGDIVRLLVGTATGFFCTALLARFLMQAARAPFRNPLGQFVFAITDWMVLPARRVIPPAWGYDTASLLLAVLWQFIKATVLLMLIGMGSAVAGALGALLIMALVATVEALLYVVMGVVLISAVMSWVNPHAPLADVFDAVARPWLRPFRQIIPPMGGIDLTPLALLVAIQVTFIALGYLKGALLGATFF